jgi:hypothetical protein
MEAQLLGPPRSRDDAAEQVVQAVGRLGDTPWAPSFVTKACGQEDVRPVSATATIRTLGQHQPMPSGAEANDV